VSTVCRLVQLPTHERQCIILDLLHTPLSSFNGNLLLLTTLCCPHNGERLVGFHTWWQEHKRLHRILK